MTAQHIGYLIETSAFDELQKIANRLGSGERFTDDKARDISNRMHLLLWAVREFPIHDGLIIANENTNGKSES